MRILEPKNLYPFHLLFFSIAVAVRAILSLKLNLIELPDSETYELFALQAYNGLPITLPTRPLGYPLFLSVIYNIFGPFREYAAYAQHFLGALTYFIYYLIFSRFFKNRLLAAVAALFINLSGTFLIFERAILSDFLNHFFLLIGILLILKYFSSGKIYLIAPLAAVTFIVSVIRPTSKIFLVLAAGFLLFSALYKLFKKEEGGAAVIKAASLYIVIFFALDLGFQYYSVSKYGFKGEPVGVFGVTMLIRTAEFMETDSALQPELKRDFQRYRGEYLKAYGQPWYANMLAGYMFLVNVYCDMPEGTRRMYLATAVSAESYYGPHAVGSDYFSTHDLLRELKCDIGTADGTALAIAKEAISANPFEYVGSTFTNLFGFIKIKAWEYRLYAKQAERNGAKTLAGIIRSAGSVDAFLGTTAVAAVFTFFFLLGAVSYFILERGRGELLNTAFLLSFLSANYLMLALIADHPVQRYKLPVYWIQFLLFIYFLPYTKRLVSRVVGKKPVLK